jgi:ribosome recycling factor
VDVKKVEAKYSQMLTEKTKNLPKDEADEAKEELEKMQKQYAEIIDKYRDQKLQEIEDSHQKWLAKEAEERLNNIQKD